MLLVHRRQAVGLVAHGVVLAADAEEAAVEQARSRRTDVVEGQVPRRQVCVHARTQLGERAGEDDHVVELLEVAPLAPALVVEVLLAPGGVDARGLDVAAGVGT
ncbi:MAG: hypothetical protein M3P44_00340, partial [Actinomycetota bacterium]|nr:hypothetical protein [Actinomycetota bacterium]